MKFNKTVAGVILFVILLLAAGYSAKSNADDHGMFNIGLGSTLINSTLRVGEVGFVYNNWEVQALIMKQGDTKNGVQEDNLEIYSVSYVTEPLWGYKGVEPYFRLGVSANSGSNLVGPTNFRLGLGVDFNKVWRLEWSHHSSASIHEVNTGIDYVTVSYQFDPFWN
jgi:hypothetical protein